MEGSNEAVYPLVVKMTILAVISPRDVWTTHRASLSLLGGSLEILFTWVCVKRQKRLDRKRFVMSPVTYSRA